MGVEEASTCPGAPPPHAHSLHVAVGARYGNKVGLPCSSVCMTYSLQRGSAAASVHPEQLKFIEISTLFIPCLFHALVKKFFMFIPCCSKTCLIYACSYMFSYVDCMPMSKNASCLLCV
jgi:hypothetical protein